MLMLALLTLGLIAATWFLLYVMQRGFERGISWFDDRNAERERALAARRAHFIKQHQGQARQAQTESAPARAPSVKDDDEEWAEYIDV